MHGVDSNVFHSYQYSALALGPLLRTHLLKLIRVISKCGFVLAARDRLELVGVLQLLDPFGLLRFETAHFCFDRFSLVILFVNPVDQVLSLLLALERFFLFSVADAFLLLALNHLFHGFILKLLGALLHRNHFFMLHLLLLQTLRFVASTHPDGVLVVHDGVLLLQASLVECLALHGLHVLLVVVLICFLVGSHNVALTDFQDVLSLLLSFLYFLPGLLLLSLEKCDTVSQDLHVFGSLFTRDSLVCKSCRN